MAQEPFLFPSMSGATRLFPGLTFLEARDLMVKQAGLTVPNRGEPRRSPWRRASTWRRSRHLCVRRRAGAAGRVGLGEWPSERMTLSFGHEYPEAVRDVVREVVCACG